MDMMGKIHPSSSKHHCFILVATDYFTKRVEAKLYKAVDQTEVIGFIMDLFHRVGFPQTLSVYNGTVFYGKMVKSFVAEFVISLVNSTPYYAQANGQAESSNKSLKKGIQKVVEDNPRDLHNLLLDVLWAYRTSPTSST